MIMGTTTILLGHRKRKRIVQVAILTLVLRQSKGKDMESEIILLHSDLEAIVVSILGFQLEERSENNQ